MKENSAQSYKAVHLEGGNFYDNMLIDISESHRRFINLIRNPAFKKKSKFLNKVNFFLSAIALKLGIQEMLVLNGIRRKWFTDFRKYWLEILDGRTIWSTFDFLILAHDYRKRQQHTTPLEWNSSSQHLTNWQNPNQIYATMHFALKFALHPIIGRIIWKKIKKNMNILEYGCSLAPYYNCYKEFFSHKNCKWVLADIPNFPFHYAKYLYRNDPSVDFITIFESNFQDPLGEANNFDIIILTEVLEHLNDPLFISDYLLKRLKPDGLLIFDYIKSEGKGLDHPKSLEVRQKCIEKIMSQTRIIYGDINNTNESIGLCIAKKLKKK